ncbi:Translin family-domain-containing protein [Dichotomocladium elegans]|nr:Translin family-domain-containing protein [Dichotomocladium elegans]
MTIQEVNRLFINEQGEQWLHVRPQDYVMGIADLTGELMRHAIATVTSGQYEKAMEICKLLRTVSTDCEVLAGSSLPLLSKKMSAMRSSVAKVERACYAFQIRGSEYPKEMFQAIIRVAGVRHCLGSAGIVF